MVMLRSVLGRLVQDQMGIFPYQLLDRSFDELIKGIELLRYQTLLLEERGNDRPTILRSDTGGIIIVHVRVIGILVLRHDVTLLVDNFDLTSRRLPPRSTVLFFSPRLPLTEGGHVCMAGSDTLLDLVIFLWGCCKESLDE